MSQAHNGLFLFGIPLIPRRSSNNWDNVLENLRTTLRSILNQTHQDFLVLIAAEDEFELPEIDGGRIQLMKLHSTHLNQATYWDKNKDASAKRVSICQKALELRVTYLMLADADDLISGNLVEFVRRNPHPIGYAITRGFVLDCNTGKILPCPSVMINVEGFDELCGTSLIYTLDQHNNLPQDWPIPAVKLGHHKVRRTMREAGMPLLDINDPMVVYVRNSGDNISNVNTDDNPHLDFATYLTRAIDVHGTPFTIQQIQEFGLFIK